MHAVGLKLMGTLLLLFVTQIRISLCSPISAPNAQLGGFE